MMIEMIRNNLTVTLMQVNVKFLQQLQPEWSRFVTIVKQRHKLDEVSYHKYFDILKQYQKEVNEIRAERIATTANPLISCNYKTQRQREAKPITHPSESASGEDSDPEQAQRDKDKKKNLELIAKYFKKIYKPTNYNLRTSSNTRNKNEVRTTDSGTDSEPLEHVQYDDGYNVFANETQHSKQPKSISNTCVVEAGDSNVIPDSPDMRDNDIQNDQNVIECDDEHVALANLIANLKLDVDKNKKIQKQLKKATHH
nr:hypothetical protein [Tanacetum cinerariifolium]